ncbi:S8 family peptidase [Actinophytocola sp.]|uniref:S8 family peptidase n=1 Tax=Actinophytocola sp. TaxID=1872138 RepID=UPI002ED2F9A8
MIHARARATLTGLLAAATASTAVLSGSAAAAPAVKPATPLGSATTVTLITGDVVTLGDSKVVDVTAARGREHIGFRTYTDEDGDVNVIPEDAMSLVSSGRVDPRLFDVSELARSGYGDADREDVPLIVDYPGATPRAAGARAVRELPSVSAVAMRAEKSPTFWATARTSASRIWLDGPVKASLEHSVPQIGAPEAWAAGHTGAGTTVAVLDTGVDATHPDLDDAITGAQDFSESETGVDDRFGHGTHVASIITGDGAKNKGVAPDAKLLNGKVLNDFGSGAESWIIAGMEWAAASGADVINMSLGSPWPSDGTDPMSLAVDEITAKTGALFVIAAGNSGPGDESIGSPAAADAALTVGAVDRNDDLAEFSSRGPRWGNGAIKPDITAPGVNIVAAKAAHGQIGDPAGEGYVSLSGTSMATPHVAGAAAILAGQHPDWQADRLKSTLMSSARSNPELSVYEQGAGRVDVAAATTASVTAAPGSLSIGTVQWPHNDDQPVTKTVTYTNSGSAPVTLDVTAEMTGPNGNAAPAGMFTVSPARVTVPAGGTAEATLTTNTRVEAADGVYTGTLVATGGGTTIHTPAAVNREVESYDLKLTFLDHNGNPTPQYWFRYVDHTKAKAYLDLESDPSGSTVVRVPKGTFYFDGWVQTELGEREWLSTDFIEPAIVVDGPAEFTFDARTGTKLGFTVDKPEAVAGSAYSSALMKTAWGETGAGRYARDFEDYSIRPSQTSAPGDFTFEMNSQLARPDGTETGPGFHASPYLYNLYDIDKSGGVPADLINEVDVRKLAKVVSSYAVGTPGKIGVRDGIVTMALPYTLTEFYTPGSEWRPYFYETTNVDEWPPSGIANFANAPVSYQRGRTVKERWNVGVFGPGFAYASYAPGQSFARLGDEFLFSVGLHSDQNPGHDGSHGLAEGTTQILRDGAVVAESPYPGYVYTVLPPEAATYTARTTSTQPGRLSTRIDGEWTFRTGHTEGEEPTAIPALAVRFAPNLDNDNAAKAGKKFSFPVYVQRNGAQEPGRVNTPVVEISYDDGKTWQKVRISRHHGQWTAEVNHPKRAEFASLRWSVSDAGGNSAKATIIHAYALKK